MSARCATACATGCSRRSTTSSTPRRGAAKVAGSCHVAFRGVDAELLVVALDRAGVCASAGSSCSSGATQSSHVLDAMGLPPDEQRGAVRFSLGAASDDTDVDARARRDPRRRRVAPRACRGRRAMTARREVLVAMSGGVDSSVAAALLLDAGHDVTGVTLRLWGGETESGCCSVSDVEDARRVAAQLGIPHYVFNLSEEFERAVVDGYVDAYASGRTPNPCVECNRSIKFGALLERADVLGFDAVATGHHARIVERADGSLALGAWRRPGEGPVVRPLHAGPARAGAHAAARRRR